MRFEYYSLTIYFSWILIYLAIKYRASGSEHEDTLVLVHVLFRHGDRTPNGPEELYPKDPYLNEKYWPTGLGQLTLQGKKKEFLIGKALRQKYNEFLGPLYYPEIVDARSTDYNRTKASIDLVLAGLFPPARQEEWDPILNWQPIPYNYYPRREDEILIGVYCPTYLKLYEQVLQSYPIRQELKKHKAIFNYISTNTGLNVTHFEDLYNLYFGLSTEEEWGFELPPWTKKVWPKTILDLATKYYFVATATKQLKRMASGYFIQKVIQDTLLKIEGHHQGQKIYLYSAHENNIAEVLILLELFSPPHIPKYGSYVVFEVHKIKNSYAIKIFYEDYTANKPRLLKLPGCDHLCDLKKFIEIVKEYLPSPDLCKNGDNTV